MKYFLYARKSTDSEERQILSIEAQLVELKEFAAKEKLEIVASLCEAKTAKEPGREIFNEMLDRIEKGEACGVLAWHPDRLARNSIDGGKIIYLLDTGRLKDLKFPTFWFDSTPQGKFMLNIAFGQSKYYIDNLSENVKRGHRQKVRNGIWPAFAPLGYLNNYKTKGIEVDTEKAPLIRKAFELYATGDYTLLSIKQFLERAGMKSYRGYILVPARVQHMLKSPFYYGVFRYNGEMHEGTHEPIISKSLYEQAQQVMANRGKKKRKRKHEFAFSGLMRCGNCGCMITAEKQKGHIYYRCTKKKQKCDEKYTRQESIIDQMKDAISKTIIPDDWVKKMLIDLNNEKELAQAETKSFVQNLQQKKSDIAVKMDKLLDLFIEGEGIDPETYQVKKNALLNEKLDIQQKIKDFEQKGNNWLEPMKEIILSGCQAKNLIATNNYEEILTFLKNIGSNFILKGKKLQFDSRIGWRPLFKNAQYLNHRRRWDSNPRYAFT
ncbi:MAG: recombinase family protein [Candidatus Saganbacteria bacterium]|nr:recombinase family protein [Candidatus Saganbacteria bacterium]